MGKERKGSVSAAGGQNPNPAGPREWAPFLWGTGRACLGQAEVPDLLPSWPLQSPGQFLTSPESEVDWASGPRCPVQVQMLS